MLRRWRVTSPRLAHRTRPAIAETCKTTIAERAVLGPHLMKVSGSAESRPGEKRVAAALARVRRDLNTVSGPARLAAAAEAEVSDSGVKESAATQRAASRVTVLATRTICLRLANGARPNTRRGTSPAKSRSVPRARIELATHGSSGHVPGSLRIRASTQSRRHMVMTNDKWFNKKDGGQALPSLAVTIRGIPAKR